MLPLTPCCNAESIYSHARAPLKAPISLLVLASSCSCPGSAVAEPQHGIAMHGAPARAGRLHPLSLRQSRRAARAAASIFGVQGSFDSLNPLIVKGDPAEGVRDYVYESLLARANDEPFTLYGLIAESVETPPDRSFVEFTLRPEAKFSDGTPITVDDVIFSHRAAARSWPAQSPLLLQEGRQGRADRRAQGADSPSIERRPRDAADHRADAGPAASISSIPSSSRRPRSCPRSAAVPTPSPRSTPARAITFKRDPELLGPRSSGQSRAL